MCSFKRIAISSRQLCPRPLPDQIRRLKGQVDAFILREKDMEESEYRLLAMEVQETCMQTGILFICHTFLHAARQAGCSRIHLPFPQFMDLQPEGFDRIGVSVHSLEEALQAQQAGADYLIVGNIFETACKQGLPGKGTEFLREICRKTLIPVYGLGGITETNERQIQMTGAAGACRMSDYMKQ